LLAVLVLLIPCAVCSAAGTDTVDEAAAVIDGITAWNLKKSGQNDIQSWIDTALADNAGIISEWYVYSLYQSGIYDFSVYAAALDEYVASKKISAASSRQKYALVLTAVLPESDYIDTVTEESIGAQGIMSYVFGLHLLNNGRTSKSHTTESVVEKLLTLECEGGGWSLNGKSADVDVTAMTVQALAPYYGENAEVKRAVDDALGVLSELQLDSGGFIAYGKENSESAAQVIIALSSLGIDCIEDERFIKNGRNLFDVIAAYRLDDGSFGHDDNSASNETATVQVMCAMTAYLRMHEGRAPFYILDPPTPQKADTPSESSTVSVPETPRMKTSVGYKPIAAVVILAVGAVVCAVLFIVGKRSKKNFIVVILLTAAAVVFVLVTDFSTADSYYTTAEEKQNVIGSVSLSISCKEIADLSDAEHIPDDGVILEMTGFAIAEGDTVYDILVEAARGHGIQLENNGTRELAYISGIAYIYEFDFGDTSGWTYLVNGETPSVGCGEYRLSDGDVIEWVYTTTVGSKFR